MNCEQGFIGKEIGGQKFGIPDWIFQLENFSGKQESLSGNPLYFCLNPRIVSIYEHGLTSKSCCFQANVSNEVLDLMIYTKFFKGKEQRHPDLFPAKLIEKSMSFFSKNETKISKFRLNFFGQSATDKDGSDTYQQFVSALKKTSDPILACQQTWAAQQMAKFGFTDPDHSSFFWKNSPRKREVCLNINKVTEFKLQAQ